MSGTRLYNVSTILQWIQEIDFCSVQPNQRIYIFDACDAANCVFFKFYRTQRSKLCIFLTLTMQPIVHCFLILLNTTQPIWSISKCTECLLWNAADFIGLVLYYNHIANKACSYY